MVLVPVWAQKTSFKYSNQPLTQALNSLSEKYNLKIAFDTKIADKTIINTSASNVSIEEALASMVNETGLMVQQMGDVYMIIPKPVSDNKTELVIEFPKEKVRTFICGVVRDKLSGESLPYASIYLSEKHIGTNTNADGYFRMEVEAEDTILFAANYVGYLPVAFKALPKEKPSTITILLEPQVNILQEVVVRDRLDVFDNSGLNVERVKFSPSKMNNIPSITELDIMAPMQMLPGINATNENAGGFRIHNSAPDKTLIVYDGFTLYHMNHFFGAFSSINNKTVKDVQVYKNGYSPKSGGSAAGLIEITGKSGNMQKPIINIGADMLAADAELEIPIIKNKCSFLFAGRRSFTDVLRTPLYTTMFKNARYDFNSYYRKPPVAFTSDKSDPEYFYSDFNTKLTLRTSENSTISLSGFVSSDELTFSQIIAYPKMMEKTEWGTSGISLRWSGKIAQNWQSEVILGKSKSDFDYSFSDTTERERKRLSGIQYNYINKNSAIDSWLKNTSLNWSNSFLISKNQEIEAGFSIQKFRSLYNYSASTYFNEVNIQDTTRTYQKTALLNSLWTQYKLSGERWELKPGFRISKYSITNKVYPEFRLSALYKINPLVTLKANTGNYSQFINKVNILPQGDFRSVWVVSDEEKVPVVKSFSTTAGANIAITSNINLDFEAYYITTNSLVSSLEIYRIANNTVRLGKTNWLYDQQVKGIDILLKQTYGNYQWWTAYTLSQSLSTTSQNGNSAEYPSDNDQLHEIKMLHMLKLGNWVLSMNGIYGSGITWNDYELNENYRLSKDYQRNGSRVPAYLRIDAGLNYSFRIGKSECKLGSNLFNIFDKKNIIQRFNKLSPTPVLDTAQGLDPIQENSIYGLGFSYNFFFNIVF
jgi:hypothetical protein